MGNEDPSSKYCLCTGPIHLLENYISNYLHWQFGLFSILFFGCVYIQILNPWLSRVGLELDVGIV